MPPKRRDGRRKAGRPQDEANADTNATCDLCCKPIVEDRDEGLLCEGTCNRWLHRYCAGVTETQYEALQDSPLPFLCFMCSQSKQAAVIKVMQEKIDSLTAEVIELRSNVADLHAELQLVTSSNTDGEPTKSSAGSNNTWTEVVRRGRRRTTPTTTSVPRPKHPETRSEPSNAPKRQRRQGPGPRRVAVPGARRIWGTLKSTTTRAVEKVITTLTKVSSSELRIRRKYKTATDNAARVVRWWFVIRADNSVLEQLEKEWNPVAIQTDWKLTPLLQHATPNPGETSTDPSQVVNSGPCIHESPAELDTETQQPPTNVQQASSNEQTNTSIIQESSQSADYQLSLRFAPQTGTPLDHTQSHCLSQADDQGRNEGSTISEQPASNDFLEK